MNNPFNNVVNESTTIINEIESTKNRFIEHLNMVSESLNNIIPGDYEVKMTNEQPKLNKIEEFLLLDGKQQKADYVRIFLSQTETGNGFIIGGVWFDGESKTMTLEFNKIKISFNITEEGIVECISSIIRSPNIMGKIIHSRKKKINLDTTTQPKP